MNKKVDEFFSAVGVFLIHYAILATLIVVSLILHFGFSSFIENIFIRFIVFLIIIQTINEMLLYVFGLWYKKYCSSFSTRGRITKTYICLLDYSPFGAVFRGLFLTLIITPRDVLRHELYHARDIKVLFVTLLRNIGFASVASGISSIMPRALGLYLAPLSAYLILLTYIAGEIDARRFGEGKPISVLTYMTHSNWREYMRIAIKPKSPEEFAKIRWDFVILKFATIQMAMLAAAGGALNFIGGLPRSALILPVVVVAFVGAVSALAIFIYVLNVFSRRLFGDVLGWFAAPGAVLGGVLHPLAGLALAFLSVWLVSDRRTAIVMTALSVLVVAYIWAVYHVAYHFLL
ncbi:hypothetical protein [Pyrobaculum sp.]|uniref:hypothetical protein n=1 Tax=Pyrobaculum sp. TaxID=2004705 RepID=UPI003D10A72A